VLQVGATGIQEEEEDDDDDDEMMISFISY
jgi:hypothetical protein